MRLHFYPTCQILGCKLIDERYIFEHQAATSVGQSVADTANIALTVNRLMSLDNSFTNPNVLRPYVLQRDPSGMVLYFANPITGVVKESLRILDIAKPIVGFKISTRGQQQSGMFFLQEENGEVSGLTFAYRDEDKKKIDAIRKGKKLLIVTEGDVAGHAIRALITARSLRNLGYDPKISATGYYLDFFAEEGFECMDSSGKASNEGKRLIDFLKGDGIGMFPWNFSTVRSRIDKVQAAYSGAVQSGLDLVISDMDPISMIALQRLGRKYRKPFVALSQTHDLTFESNIPLRSLKYRGLPIGRWIDDRKPPQKIYRHVFGLVKQVVDLVAGLPLLINDPRLKCRLTDYLSGTDGTILFSLDPSIERNGYYNVGLQADRGFGDKPEASDLTRPFILNMQGSTYDPIVWSIVEKAIVSTPGSFSVHATGRKEPLSAPIYRNNRVVGLKMGYVDGFTLARQADLVVNHGGSGTMSQWLLSVAEGLIEGRETLKALLNNGEAGEILNFLTRLQRVPRSISICNTFEQENNARQLQALAGDSICSILLSDDILQEKHEAADAIRSLIMQKLTTPIDVQEANFWVQFVEKMEGMNSSAHTALLIERKMLKSGDR